MNNANTESSRPSLKYQFGQSVHHFWAPWMDDARESSLQQKEKARPKWYSAEIHSLLSWMAGTHGGIAWEGWHYRAY